jgi:hypothetical protein
MHKQSAASALLFEAFGPPVVSSRLNTGSSCQGISGSAGPWPDCGGRNRDCALWRFALWEATKIGVADTPPQFQLIVWLGFSAMPKAYTALAIRCRATALNSGKTVQPLYPERVA